MTRTAASSAFATRAVVLRTRVMGEKDRMLTLLSPELGKFSALAKGSRQPKSKLAAVAQPYMVARFLLVHGRNFAIVTQAEVEEAQSGLMSDALRSAWASYLCELCDALPEALPDPELFETLLHALAALQETGEDPWQYEIVGRWFETRFLALLGCAPTIGQCVSCSDRIAAPDGDQARPIAFSAALGGTLCPRCGAGHDRLALDALRWLHRLERSATPPPAMRMILSTRARRDLRDALRASLALQLDVRLKSLGFLDELTAIHDLPAK